MGELRPYRAPGSTALRLRYVRIFAGTALGLSFLILNWMTTQHIAWLMGDSPRLGPALFALPWTGPIYAPWKWMVWAWHWRGIQRVKTPGGFCHREGLFPIAPSPPPPTVAVGVTRQGLVPAPA